MAMNSKVRVIPSATKMRFVKDNFTVANKSLYMILRAYYKMG